MPPIRCHRSLGCENSGKLRPSSVVHVVPDDSFEDWVVRTEIGNELGHYSTREAAELAAQAMAQDQGIELVVHLPDGKTIRMNFAKGWVARLFSR
ncbi:hypothetical protein SAMN05444164_3960 [Bradyrhizobium erythrophlei]|uniref:DUF2188 domain-containing protein n=2 Tax=Bradyrhizobium erythrophlei TaxID=1437360 RepID=A0A1H4YI19_9BRAD|nr:hypothetical protein SAMN05444164_3960 [Bradyrhizobium erythrophlei]